MTEQLFVPLHVQWAAPGVVVSVMVASPINWFVPFVHHCHVRWDSEQDRCCVQIPRL